MAGVLDSCFDGSAWTRSRWLRLGGWVHGMGMGLSVISSRLIYPFMYLLESTFYFDLIHKFSGTIELD